MMKEKVIINDEYIKLDSFLKFQGLVESGGFAKQVIKEGFCKVNGEVEYRRGKKLYPKDIVEFQNKEYVIGEK